MSNKYPCGCEQECSRRGGWLRPAFGQLGHTGHTGVPESRGSWVLTGRWPAYLSTSSKYLSREPWNSFWSQSSSTVVSRSCTTALSSGLSRSYSTKMQGPL